MATRRRIAFAYAQIAWMLVGSLSLLLLDALTLETWFVLSFIGLLVVTEFTVTDVTTSWRVRVKWLVVVSFLVYAFIVGFRLAGIVRS